MKKSLFLLTVLLIISSAIAQTPRAGGINNGQATPISISAPNIVGVDATNFNAFVVYNINSLALPSSQITGLNATAVGLGSVNNTTDASKPVSGPQQIALNGKFDIPMGTSSQYVKGDGSLGTLPTISTRVFTTPTFSSSITATQLSSTKDSDTSYSYDASIAITVLGGQGITVTLTYADNIGMTTNPVIVDSNGIATSGLAGLSQIQTLTVKGYIPAGKYRQVTFTTSRTGTAILPTVPSIIKSGQEVQL